MLLRALTLSLCLASASALAGETRTFGGEMPEGPAQSIAEAIGGYAGESATPAKFSGRVAQVCRKKGCWMELEADGKSARVTMLDYGFFLPTDATGTAVVYGTLSEVELDEKTAEHFAQDAGRPADSVPRKEFRLVAHAIALTSP